MSSGKLAHCMTRRSPRCRPVEERGSEGGEERGGGGGGGRRREGGGGEERGSVKGSVRRGGEGV